MMLHQESGPTTTLGLNGVAKTVTPHLCSIGPNVQRDNGTWPTSLVVPTLFPCQMTPPTSSEELRESL